MHFSMASYQQYVHVTAKEVQTSAVNTCQILTQPSCIWCYTETLLLGSNIFSAQVSSFHSDILTSDLLEKKIARTCTALFKIYELLH